MGLRWQPTPQPRPTSCVLPTPAFSALVCECTHMSFLPSTVRSSPYPQAEQSSGLWSGPHQLTSPFELILWQGIPYHCPFPISSTHQWADWGESPRAWLLRSATAQKYRVEFLVDFFSLCSIIMAQKPLEILCKLRPLSCSLHVISSKSLPTALTWGWGLQEALGGGQRNSSLFLSASHMILTIGH